MAVLTRVITVEFEKAFKDVDEDFTTSYGVKFDVPLNQEYGCLFDKINIAKVQDFVFPDQPKAPKLTKRERVFCEFVEKGYIARDENGNLIYYATKPEKGAYIHEWFSSGTFMRLKKEFFEFITWEDDKPWAVADLLKLEVEE